MSMLLFTVKPLLLSLIIMNELVILTDAFEWPWKSGLANYFRNQWKGLKTLVGIQPDSRPFDCGKSDIHFDFTDSRKPRIFQGRRSKWHSWPWIVSILNKERGSGSLQNCAGSLVSYDTVITAAHCVSTTGSNGKPKTLPTEMVKIAVGVHTILGQMNFMNYYRVKSIELHPGYVPCCSYDIAVIKLTEKLSKSAKINTICLPQDNLTMHNRLAYIAGWGINSKSEKWYSMNSLTLKHGEVTILPDEECVRLFSGYNPNDELCALNNITLTDARAGDSGGPLMVLENGRWVLVGVTSHGVATDDSMPGFYSKLIGKMHFLRNYINKSR